MNVFLMAKEHWNERNMYRMRATAQIVRNKIPSKPTWKKRMLMDRSLRTITSNRKKCDLFYAVDDKLYEVVAMLM